MSIHVHFQILFPISHIELRMYTVGTFLGLPGLIHPSVLTLNNDNCIVSLSVLISTLTILVIRYRIEEPNILQVPKPGLWVEVEDIKLESDFKQQLIKQQSFNS